MILLDTSALAKLLVEEDESGALRSRLTGLAGGGETFAISTLAVTELRRLAIRLAIEPLRAEPVLGPFHVLRLTEGILQLAGRLPFANLGTLDAIHLATALTAEASVVVTYDRRLADAARAEGIVVEHPSV
ncbi:MAG: type II toxin-antitoxin system VapC family toxin [Microbacterium sp.]